MIIHHPIGIVVHKITHSTIHRNHSQIFIQIVSRYHIIYIDESRTMMRNHKIETVYINIFTQDCILFLIFDKSFWSSFIVSSPSFMLIIYSDFIIDSIKYAKIYTFTSTLWSSSNCSICLSSLALWISETWLSSVVHAIFFSTSDLADSSDCCCSVRRMERSERRSVRTEIMNIGNCPSKARNIPYESLLKNRYLKRYKKCTCLKIIKQDFVFLRISSICWIWCILIRMSSWISCIFLLNIFHIIKNDWKYFRNMLDHIITKGTVMSIIILILRVLWSITRAHIVIITINGIRKILISNRNFHIHFIWIYCSVWISELILYLFFMFLTLFSRANSYRYSYLPSWGKMEFRLLFFEANP